MKDNNIVLDDMGEQTPFDEVNSKGADSGIQSYTLGIPVESGELINSSIIEKLNEGLEKDYNKKLQAQNTHKENTQIKQYLTLKNSLLKVMEYDILFKMKYLKLTRVTKKIQEVVTGREQIDDKQIEKLYEDKKRNLEENTAKRISTLDKKYREIESDIRKKQSENTLFNYKKEKLKEDVEKTKQIIELDNEDKGNDDDSMGDDDKKGKGSEMKSIRIVEVSRLKALVKNHYEEIEYLRAELDKLRARTFPSFLQKPDNVIYPDEK